jgi:hypothetical protein
VLELLCFRSGDRWRQGRNFALHEDLQMAPAGLLFCGLVATLTPA